MCTCFGFTIRRNQVQQQAELAEIAPANFERMEANFARIEQKVEQAGEAVFRLFEGHTSNSDVLEEEIDFYYKEFLRLYACLQIINKEAEGSEMAIETKKSIAKQVKKAMEIVRACVHFRGTN